MFVIYFRLAIIDGKSGKSIAPPPNQLEQHRCLIVFKKKMKITISNEITDQVYGPLDVSSDMPLQDFFALVQFDCGFEEDKHELLHNMKPLRAGETKTMQEVGISDDELLVIRQKRTGSTEQVPNEEEYVERVRQELLHDASLRNQLFSQTPGIEEIINDAQRFRERVGPFLMQGRNHKQAQNPFGIPQNEYRELMSNPDDAKNQERITELINQQEIDEQMRNALEFTPEVFTPVHMLYINLEINGHPVKAFVDSGAQATIISTKLAQRTGLFRLIDKRFQGQARGVGTSNILGRIHTAQVKIETQYIPCSFTVLDTHVDMLLGLDMLKRHQACIDLKNNVLKIAGAETKFLSEAEIPKELEEALTGATEKKISSQLPSENPRPVLEANPSSTRQYPESTMNQLMSLGFSRNEVLKALNQANGNPDIAAALLFQ